MELKQLYETVVSTTEMLGGLVPIIAIAMSLNLLLTAEQVPANLANWMTSHVEDKWMFIIGLNLMLLAVGCLMEIISAILIMAPIMLPVALAYGIDPVHLGIIMVINLEIGLLTPPVGINLVVATSAFKESFLQVTKSVMPFIVLMIGVLLLVSFVPEVSLFLVN
ncbi:MAG TPA: TRAP transporter large permease subunit [Oceanospirillaceae bacterium]|jgi:C4-dicarboxylate transporter DctM subunit|nr:TRAP transporter large permease subunit [Oceanospirillaceae bacterium]